MSDLRLQNGTKLGGLVIIDQIGRGGFGITYKARPIGGGLVVALKEYFPADMAIRAADGTISPKAASQRLFFEGLKAFLNEANTLKTLPQQHGLVRVRSAFEKFSTAYCVMDYIEGEPLNKLVTPMIQQVGHVPPQLLLDLVGPVCAALEAVHGIGLVHRDVKPANIMIRRDDQSPVLIDFGAARPSGQRVGNLSMFTQKYAPLELFPPSQTRIKAKFDEGPWSDVYSLAILIYEIMAQVPPPDARERAHAVASGRPDPLMPLSDALARRGTRGVYSDPLVMAVQAGCALLPKDRTRSARAFAGQIGASIPHNPRPVALVAAKDPWSGSTARTPSGTANGPSGNGQEGGGQAGGGWKMVALILLIAGGAVALGLLSRNPAGY